MEQQSAQKQEIEVEQQSGQRQEIAIDQDILKGASLLGTPHWCLIYFYCSSVRICGSVSDNGPPTSRRNSCQERGSYTGYTQCMEYHAGSQLVQPPVSVQNRLWVYARR